MAAFGNNDLRLDFHKRFGSSFHEGSDEELNYGQDDEHDTDYLSSLSTVERAAHEHTIMTLQEMFPAWSHNDLEALLSSCGDKMDTAIEEIIRLGEGGSEHASAGLNEGDDDNDGDNDDDDDDEGNNNSQLDLSAHMTRTQLDDYERHVIRQIAVKEEEAEDLITIALSVPNGARPGSLLKVRMVDGSKYTVTIPYGLNPGEKFLAEFPTAPMRQAARRRLTGKTHDDDDDDFLSVVEKSRQQQNRLPGDLNEIGEYDHDDHDNHDDELKQALAQSLKHEDEAAMKRKQLEDEEEAMIKTAMMHSELEAASPSEQTTPQHFF